MRYAAIDIGTNSCRLLIGDWEEGKIIPIYRTMMTTRLGENMQESSTLSTEAILRTCECLNEFKKIIDEYEVQSYRAVATSAVREANNKEEFLELIKKESAIDIDIISGLEEANLSYIGVKNSLKLEKPPVVVDLGGGSTELMFEDLSPTSIPVGAVKVYEQNMSAYDVSQILKPLTKKKEEFSLSPLVCVGGTATSLVAIKFSLEVYRSELIHGQILTRSEIADLYNMLEMMPLSLRKRLPGLQPERADIIPSGTLIMLIIMDILGKEDITVSESDILEGIILNMKRKA